MSDGLPFEVSRRPISGSAANFRDTVLRFPSPDVAEVRSVWQLWLIPVLFVAFGIFALILGVYLYAHDGDVIPVVICVMVGVGLTFFGLLAAKIFASSSIVIDKGVGTLGRSRRLPLWAGRRSRLDIKDIAAVQICSKRVSTEDDDYSCFELNLVFSQPEGRRLNVMSHGNEASIRSDAQRLAEFFNGPLLDHSKASPKNPAASVAAQAETIQVEELGFSVSKSPVATSSYSFRETRLKIVSSNVAVLKRTLGGWIFAVVFLGFGIGGIAVGVFGPADFGWFGAFVNAMFCFAGVLITLVGLLLLIPKRIVIDRSAGTITSSRKLPRWLDNRKRINIEDIAAFQVSSGYRKMGSGVSMELNLVFRRPQGKRLTILSHEDHSALKSDAEQLAEFLNKPLLDHSECD